MSRDTNNSAHMTNYYSITSKHCAVKNGYYQDEFLESLFEDLPQTRDWQKPAKINRFYATRSMAVDWVIDRSIRLESLDCIIILGAGYDTLANRHLFRCRWIEIDFEQTIMRKLRVIRKQQLVGEKSKSLREREPGLYSLPQYNYNLIGCDLRDVPRLAGILASALNKMGPIAKVAILNEVCLNYLKPDQVERVLQMIIDILNKKAQHIYYISFEPVLPSMNSPLGIIMRRHFEALGHPLKTFLRPDQIRDMFLRRLTFNHLTISSLYQIYHNVLAARKLETPAFQLDSFDDFEDMDLMLNHYALITGSLTCTEFNNRSVQVTSVDELETSLQEVKLEQKGIEFLDSTIERFSHSSCVIRDGVIFVCGGVRAGHRITSDCLRVSFEGKTGQPIVSECQIKGLSDGTASLARQYGQSCALAENAVFVCGGREATNGNRLMNDSLILRLAGGGDNTFTVHHLFDSETARGARRWRHSLSPIVGQRVYQFGGLAVDPNVGQKASCIVWDFSADKLGCQPLSDSHLDHRLGLFERHSFGLDMINGHTIFMLGGLNAQFITRDRPVDPNVNSVLWDLRANEISAQFTPSGQCYGSRVHFVSEHELVRLGGTSTLDGASLTTIEAVDLRRLDLGPTYSCSVPETGNGCPLIMSNFTSFKLGTSQGIMSIGGGGDYFSFGTHFNRTHLVYDHSKAH